MQSTAPAPAPATATTTPSSSSSPSPSPSPSLPAPAPAPTPPLSTTPAGNRPRHNNHHPNHQPAAAAAAASPPGFEFPREYDFPPFFTRQPNATTRYSQLAKWSALALAWARHRRAFRLSVAEEALFHNRRLGRRLGPADARDVLEFMRREGRAEPVVAGSRSAFGGGGDELGLGGGGAGGGGGGDDDGGGGGGGGGGGPGGDGKGGGGAAAAADVYWVYWKTPEEWAQDLEAWVDETAQKGAVFTLYELTEGEDTRGAEFHGLDPELLQKALQVLVKRGKAQIFGQEDQQGVKFF